MNGNEHRPKRRFFNPKFPRIPTQFLSWNQGMRISHSFSLLLLLLGLGLGLPSIMHINTNIQNYYHSYWLICLLIRETKLKSSFPVMKIMLWWVLVDMCIYILWQWFLIFILLVSGYCYSNRSYGDDTACQVNCQFSAISFMFLRNSKTLSLF